MARPKDRGEQFPSDSGDSAPTNPADGLSQRDFNPDVNVDSSFNVKARQHIYNVGGQIQNPNTPTHQSWSGIIQEWVRFQDFFHVYNVIRHDGLVVQARHITHEAAKRLDPDVSVVVNKDLSEDVFTIVGTPEVEVAEYWIKIFSGIDARPGEFGTSTTGQGKLWYYDGSEFVTQEVLASVLNATTVAIGVGFYQVRLITNDDNTEEPLWEIISGSIGSNVYYCRVNKSGGVSADSAFPADDVDVIDGETPPDPPNDPGEIATVQNTKFENFADDEFILVHKNSSDGLYYSVKLGGGGNRFRYFELREELSPFGGSDNHIADAIDIRTQEEIKVLDVNQVMTGHVSYSGANQTTQPAYRGVAEEFTSDYQDTGKPGCNILSMEGPQIIIVVRLTSNIISNGASLQPLVCNFPSSTYGSNYSGRMAKGSIGLATVYNTCGFAAFAKAGEEWICFYQNDTQRYELVVRLQTQGASGTIVVKINGTIGGANLSAGVAPGIGAGFRLTWNGDKWVDAGEGTLILQNHSESTIEGPITLRADLIEGQWVLDMPNLNALRGADAAEYQIVFKKAGNKDWQLESLEDFVTGIAQPIHHEAGGDDLRFKDSTECP